MKLLFTLFFLFTAFLTRAQFITNVNWTMSTDLPAADVIYYKPAASLVWDDFQGAPVSTGIVAAITSSGFGYNASMRNAGDKGTLQIGVYCYFSKGKSWVKPGRKTDYILRHEQHHFDISYIAANLFVSRLRNAVITPSNCNTLLPQIYKECCTYMNKLQDDYDGQTHNGQLNDVQEKWNSLLNDKLAVLTD